MELFTRLNKSTALTVLVVVVSAGAYIKLSYFTDRADFPVLITLYATLFACYYFLIRSELSISGNILLGIILRLVLFFSFPNLSDDYFRFFWDGLLASHGVNPFAYLPSEIVERSDLMIPGIDRLLYERLNSPDYYTIYPPWCQFVFMVSAMVSKGNLYVGVLIMRLFALAAEIGTMLLLYRLLPSFNKNLNAGLLYIFNPLVILELTGNLHYEVFMIFFTLLAVYLLKQKKVLLSAFVFALAIAAKLLPLILMPYFLRKLGWKRAVKYYVWVGIFTVLIFLPLLGSALFGGLSSSLSLYFQKFEFNASIYYLIREVGYWMVGWNIIQIAGKWLAVLVFVLVVLLSLFYNKAENTLLGMFVWPLLIYLALATIVHPWYITPLVAFCVFSNYRFPIVWSFFVFLSYEGYSSAGFEENMFLLWVEYLCVYAWMVYELRRERNLIKLDFSMRSLISEDVEQRDE
jgi:alpha-1,6-mannosyltransferase